MKPIIDKKLPRIFDKDLEYFQERMKQKNFIKTYQKWFTIKQMKKKWKISPLTKILKIGNSFIGILEYH